MLRLEEQRVESGCSISTLLLYQGESQNLVHTQMWCSTAGDARRSPIWDSRCGYFHFPLSFILSWPIFFSTQLVENYLTDNAR